MRDEEETEVFDEAEAYDDAEAVDVAEPVEAGPTLGQRFQRLKAAIHRQLVQQMDISQLANWQPDRLRREVRTVASRLAQSTPELLREVDRERLVDEIM